MLPPWAAISMSTRAWSGSETLASPSTMLTTPGNISCGSVYSWLTTSRPCSEEPSIGMKPT